MPIKRIIAGLNEFHDNYFVAHRELFEHLSHGQNPEVLFITCSDSRIDPFLITQSQPGDLFVIRNVGNIIPPYGRFNGGEAAGIEYAVEALGIKDVVVCGHSHCGAMRGLLQIGNLAQQMPSVYEWLRYHAESTRRLVMDNYQGYSNEQLLKIAIEQNVLTQIENLETYPVIRSKLHSGQLTLHAWIYEIESGGVFAYDADNSQFKILENRPFPVPNPLIGVHSCDLKSAAKQSVVPT
ncbi:carbonic anhydrase [Nostoc sp. TCL26-01]|uniref:carbonic anhydrase n=1 Tax=Nostoc sp. TCL26-01 TaxID=2576904 RepID=UPI0015BD9507|nr:carbonic anhydrase [Nostoc sp. TCL26-01]QLE56455.1 carbonic anhydrase [Nostoc sp. TCL26-01]